MVGYAILAPLSTDEKSGYEIHPIGGGGGDDGGGDPTPYVPLALWDVTPETLKELLDTAIAEWNAELDA
jgi:hypothetical protein